MSKQYPDFTDVFYAGVRVSLFARKGLDLQEAGDKKGARAAYKEALHWEREQKRLASIDRANRLLGMSLPRKT